MKQDPGYFPSVFDVPVLFVFPKEHSSNNFIANIPKGFSTVNGTTVGPVLYINMAQEPVAEDEHRLRCEYFLRAVLFRVTGVDPAYDFSRHLGDTPEEQDKAAEQLELAVSPMKMRLVSELVFPDAARVASITVVVS